MSGKVMIFSADIDQPIALTRRDSTPSLEELQKLVGGYIEAVPHWDRQAGLPCVAWCNEEGKLDELPVNVRATAAWYVTLGQRVDDVLVGNVVLCIGFEDEKDADDE